MEYGWNEVPDIKMYKKETRKKSRECHGIWLERSSYQLSADLPEICDEKVLRMFSSVKFVAYVFFFH